MYALAGIPEYWVIDLNDYKIRVYRQPDGDKYLFEEIIDETGIATCETIDFQLNAKELKSYRTGDFSRHVITIFVYKNL